MGILEIDVHVTEVHPTYPLGQQIVTATRYKNPFQWKAAVRVYDQGDVAAKIFVTSDIAATKLTFRINPVKTGYKFHSDPIRVENSYPTCTAGSDSFPPGVKFDPGNSEYFFLTVDKYDPYNPSSGCIAYNYWLHVVDANDSRINYWLHPKIKNDTVFTWPPPTRFFEWFERKPFVVIGAVAIIAALARHALRSKNRLR